MNRSVDSRRVFRVVLLGALLVQTAWILALPAFRGIDEFDHVYKAAAVARGQWTSSGQAAHGRGGLVRIPGDIVAAASAVCTSYEYTRPDDCTPVRRFANGDVEIASAASAYNPAYYLVVGTLARPFRGVQVDYVIRCATALACALLLAWAGAVVASWGRSRWALVAFLLGLTPVLVYSTAIASPNGIAYSGAALLWVSLLSVVRRPPGRRIDAAGAAVGAVALVTTHGTGPLLAFLILGLVLLLVPVRTWWRTVSADPRAWLAAATVVLLVTLACVAWIAYAHPAAIGEPTDPPPTLGDYLTFQALWTLESVAVFPTVTEYPPLVVYALWGVPLATLLFLLLRHARSRFLLVVLGALALLVALPTAYTTVTYADNGLVWQGRYSLPLWVGITALAALTASTRREVRPALAPVVLALAAAGVSVSLVAVAHREIASGVADPGAAGLPGGLVLVGALGLAGTLLPALLLRTGPVADPGHAEPAEPGISHAASDRLHG